MTELPSRIPADLYQVITEHISRRRDLATLCRVSRVFRHEAERALYRKVVVREETVMFFCHGGVLTNRRLASMVRSLSLTLSSSTFPFYQSAAMLSDALRGLSNLRNLELWGSAMPHLIHSQFIFRGCKLNLQRFGSSVPLDTQLIQFLATQPNITHWTTTSRAYIEIPGSILPHLSCIDASASAMEKVTDQRHLTHIRVNRAGNALPTNLLGPWTVSISLQPIVLSSQLVNINEDWRSVCRTIAKLAPNVRFLEISRSRLVRYSIYCCCCSISTPLLHPCVGEKYCFSSYIYCHRALDKTSDSRHH